MSADPFDELLDLENDFYKEGFEAGVADSAYAGLVEGKVFGIEKGYETALEIGRARGRAMVWQRRLETNSLLSTKTPASMDGPDISTTSTSQVDRSEVTSNLSPLPDNNRLRKHLEVLMSLTSSDNIPNDNSDDSVGAVDERIIRIGARMKMISNLVGEALSPATTSPAASIEDSVGLSARH